MLETTEMMAVEAADASASTSGSTMTVGENRIALTVTEADDAKVAMGMFERFARRHGADPSRVAALHDAGRELGRTLFQRAGGGLLEAERVGSFIEVRAVGRVRESEDAVAVAHDASELDLALARMDGAERADASKRRFIIRTWCGLD